MLEFNSTLYVKRDLEQELFLEALHSRPEDSNYLDIYGPVGMGKTTFLTWVKENGGIENYLVSYVDLANSQNFYESIAEQLYDHQRFAVDPFLEFKHEFYSNSPEHSLTDQEIGKFQQGLQEVSFENRVVLAFDNTDAVSPTTWQTFEENILKPQSQIMLVTAGQKPLTLKTLRLRNRLKSIYLSYFTARKVTEQLQKWVATKNLQLADEDIVVSKLMQLTHGHPLSVETVLTLWSNNFRRAVNAQTVAEHWANGVEKLLQDVVSETLNQWQLDSNYPYSLSIVQHTAPLRNLVNKDFYHVLAQFFPFFAEKPSFFAERLIPELQRIHLTYWTSGIGSKWHPMVRSILLEHLRVVAREKLQKVHQILAELYRQEVHSCKEGNPPVAKLVEQFYHLAASLTAEGQEDVTKKLCGGLQSYLKGKLVSEDLLTQSDKQWLSDLRQKFKEDDELATLLNVPTLLKVIDNFMTRTEETMQTEESSKELLPGIPPSQEQWLFVGRDQEIELFNKLLAPDSKTRILATHTRGQGGVGKTTLLLQLQTLCQKRQNLLYNPDLIDFFHSESRSRIGVIGQLATHLNLTETRRHIERARRTSPAEREKLEAELWGSFVREYTNTCQDKRQLLVFFFDSYEYVQQPSDAKQDTTEATGFSEWLETQLFPALVEGVANTRLVIAGRYLLNALQDYPLVDSHLLLPFPLAVTQEFLRKRNLSENESLDDLAPPKIIEAFHHLSGGQPVFLALLSDWIKTAPSTLEQFQRRIEEKTGQAISTEVTLAQRAVFEKTLIDHIHQFLGTSELAVTYLAVAWRRTTPEILSELTGDPIPRCEETINLFKKKWGASFIKVKSPREVLLHDEMARLLNQYFWQDNQLSYEKGLQQLVQYYDQLLEKAAQKKTAQLSEADREAYTLELIGYAFQANFANGLSRFNDEFDLAIEDGRYDYGESLLQEAERALQKQKGVQYGNTLDFLHIPLRRFNYNLDKGEPSKVLLQMEEYLTQYQEDPRWQESEIQGHFWLSKGQALALRGDTDYDSVISAFEQATTVFSDIGEDQWANWTMNRIGESYFQQGHFSEAETWFLRSQRGFHILLGQTSADSHQADKKHASRQILQGVQKTLGNLARVYFYTGRFHWAFTSASSEFEIVRRLERNSKELVYSLNTLAKMSACLGQTARTNELLEEALTHLERLRVPLQQGQVKLNQFWLAFRKQAFTYPLEFYRACELEELFRSTTIDVATLQKHLEDAIALLNSLPGTLPHHLAEAYLARAELQLVMADFAEVEHSLERGWQCAKESHFAYWQVTALKDFVRLYYTWQQAPDRDRKLNQYKEELEKLLKTPLTDLPEKIQPLAKVARTYSEMVAKYEMVQGHFNFDKAIHILQAEKSLDKAIESLNKAVIHYIKATEELQAAKGLQTDLLQAGFKKLHHLGLSVFRQRLHTFIECANQQGVDEKRLAKRLDVLTANWVAGEHDQLYQLACLGISPERKREDLQKLEQTLSAEQHDQNVSWLILRGESLIAVFRRLEKEALKNESEKENLVQYRKSLINGLIHLALWNHQWGDEYAAWQQLEEAKRCLESLKSSGLQQPAAVPSQIEVMNLDSRVYATEGFLRYRQDRECLEFYEFSQWRSVRRQTADNERALRLLRESERIAYQALERLCKPSEVEENRQQLENTLLTQLGTVRLWLGECLTWEEQFQDKGDQPGAFSCLEKARENFKKSGETYREMEASVSHLTARYLSETEIQEKETLEVVQNGQNYPNLLGKLRLTQGNLLFSSRNSGGGDKRRLRKMLRHYVEACDCLARTKMEASFQLAVRVLWERISMIDDQLLKELRQGLLGVWFDYPSLEAKERELGSLQNFIDIKPKLPRTA